MNKGINKSRIVACMLAAGFLAVGSGCTDSDFDLSNIDQTIGIGGDGLQLPTNSTENIVLDDLLDLNNSDFISIAENGDYMFSKQRGCVKTLLFLKNHKALTFTSQGFAMSKSCCNFRP